MGVRMARKPTIKSVNGPIGQFIGSSYDIVKKVYDNLPLLESINQNAENITQQAENAVVEANAVLSAVESTQNSINQTQTEINNTASEVDADKVAAESAATYAEQSKLDAATSESNAATSASNAASSASAANLSEQSATAAATSANSSEAAASQSEQNASVSEINAKASETAAKTSETNASQSESNALASEQAALISKQNAALSEANAADSEEHALASEQSASLSETKAQLWAEESENIEVETGAYSAKHHALKSEESASNSAQSASSAQTSASNASTSENNASDSELAAKQSEDNALTSEQNAATSATNASTSESAAASSASAASVSEQNALNSALNALSSEQAAESALSTFREVHWGAYSTEPTQSPNGNAPAAGNMYYNTSSEILFYYDGNKWVDFTRISADNKAKLSRIEAQAKLDESATLIMDYANNKYQVYEQFEGKVSKLAPQIQTFTRSSEKTGSTPKGVGTVTVNQPVIELGKGISIHEQQTNLFSTNSTSGFAVGRSSRVSSETVRGVDGFVYRGNSGEVNPLIINNQVTAITVGNTYSFSIYVQKRESDECEIVLATNGAAANGVKVLFNFSDESSFVVYNNTEYMSLYDFSYEKLSDGFYRLMLTGTLVTGISLFCLLYWEDEKDIWAGGAQLEEGTFSSPLIPSNDTQETRQADFCTIDNIDQSNWWNPNEGTFVVEFESKGIAAVGNASAAFYAYSSSPSLDAITVRVLTSGLLNAFISDSSGNTKTLEFGITDSFNKKIRAVLSIGNGVLKAVANGGAVNSVTTGIQQPAPLLLSVGGRKTGGQEVNGTIKFIAYIPKAVSDTQLQKLSTL